MLKLNFKVFIEAEESKQASFIPALTSVLGVEPKHVRKALDGLGPVLISQKVYDDKAIAIAPTIIKPNKKKNGADIEILTSMSPYVTVKNRLNKNTKKNIKGFVDEDQMDKLYTLGFPNSEGKPETPESTPGGAL
jgi:hypothetical protein